METVVYGGFIIRLTLHIQPNAKKSEFAGTYGDATKVRIKAPAVDNKANEELIRFIANHYGVAKGNVSIVLGLTGRRKILEVKGK